MKAYSERRHEVEEAQDEIARALCEGAEEPTDDALVRMVNGVGTLVIGVWHELHRIANALNRPREGAGSFEGEPNE